MPVATISEGTAIGGTVFAGVTDLILQSAAPTTHNNNAQTMEVKYWTSSDISYVVMQFLGLSNITGPVTVTNAVLGMQVSGATAFTDPITIHQLKLPVSMTQATWNERQTGVSWPNGGNDPTTIEAAAASTTAATGSVGTFVTWSGAGLNALVQGWINGTITNNGILIARLDTTPNSRSSTFRSSNNATLTARPYLTVTYDVGLPVNWTINSPTVNSDAGTVTLTVTLDGPAPGGGFSGLVNTYDITAVAGVDYTAQVAVPFSISAGNTTGNIVIPILP